MVTWTKSTDQPGGGILHQLQWHDARLRQPSQYGIAIVESTDDESLDQIGSCLLTENVSHGLQTSKVITTNTGSLADVFLHGQLTVHDDAEVANDGGGTDDVIPDMQCEMDVFHFLQAGLGAKPDGVIKPDDLIFNSASTHYYVAS